MVNLDDYESSYICLNYKVPGIDVRRVPSVIITAAMHNVFSWFSSSR